MAEMTIAQRIAAVREARTAYDAIYTRYMDDDGDELGDAQEEAGRTAQVVAHHQAPALCDEVERLEAQLRRYQDREQHFVKVLGVCDGGQYRSDWGSRIEQMVAENATLRALLLRCRTLAVGLSEDYSVGRDFVLDLARDIVAAVGKEP